MNEAGHEAVKEEEKPRECLVCLQLASATYKCSECQKVICRNCYKNSVKNNYEAELCLDCNNLYYFDTLRHNRTFLGVQKRATADILGPAPAKKGKRGGGDAFQTSYIRCCDVEVDADNEYTCVKCSKKYCAKCRNEDSVDHKCNTEDIETTKFLRETESTKPCPKCRTLIERSYGCNHMFCISCRTSYDWVSGDIIRVSSNPLFLQYRGQIHDCQDNVMPHLNNESLHIAVLVRSAESAVFSVPNRQQVFKKNIYIQKIFGYIYF